MERDSEKRREWKADNQNNLNNSQRSSSLHSSAASSRLHTTTSSLFFFFFCVPPVPRSSKKFPMSLKTLLRTLLLLFGPYCLLFAEGKSLRDRRALHHDELGAIRISHGGRGSSGEVPPESLLISRLSESSNEISSEKFDKFDEKFDYSEDSYGANGDTQKKSAASHNHNLPLYLELIDEQLKKEELKGEEEPSGPLIRAWFPSRISRSLAPRNPPSTLLSFAQVLRHSHLRSFVKAEFILSLKAAGSLGVRDEDLVIRVQVGEEIVQSKVLRFGSKEVYFTLNITSFLTSYLQNHEAPSEVTFNCTVASAVDKSSTFFLDEIFDMEKEKPGIVLFYKELIVDVGEGLSSHRSKRSVESVETPQTSNSTSSSSLSNYTSGRSNSSSSNSTSSSSLSNYTAGRSNSTSTSTLHLPDQLNLCRRVEWSVSVEDIDWGEVISHRQLDLGYCAGDCPFPLENEHYNFTLHSYFLDKYKRNRHSEIPSNFPRRSCCIPITYSPIRVWVEEEEQVLVLSEYDNVLVKSCGCR